MDRFVLSIGSLETGRNGLDLAGDPGPLNLESWVRIVAPVAVQGYVDRFGETLTIRGAIRSRVEETCGRCARLFQRPLDVELMVFCDRWGVDQESVARELEREGHLVYHDGISVDLTGPVREAVILSLPMTPLCRDDCRGLCAGCGVDLNTEACRCRGEKADPRWSALSRLKDRQE